MTDDIYQERYLEHIERKRQALSGNSPEPSLWSVIRWRHSQRKFLRQPIGRCVLDTIYDAICMAPSSCNRQAILVKEITAYPDLAELEGLLVGGARWLSNAPVVLLLFADMKAYKSPGEENYMPWLDAGFVAENVYLAAEALGLGCCYVNPHIRTNGELHNFHGRFNPLSLRFCGAIALGYYDVRPPEAPKRSRQDIFYPTEA